MRDCLFHGLHKQLCNSMCYLYDDARITYPQLMMAAQRLGKSKRTNLRRESEQNWLSRRGRMILQVERTNHPAVIGSIQAKENHNQ